VLVVADALSIRVYLGIKTCSLPNEYDVRYPQLQTALYDQRAGSGTPSAQALRSRMIPNAPLLYPPPNIKACYASACPHLRVEACTLLCSGICRCVTCMPSGEATTPLTPKGGTNEVAGIILTFR
jgi:hypothetical protein